jgi:hypothetical protein
MYLAMVAHIIFPATATRKEISVRRPTAVKIESGWEMLTDTAVIVLPRNVSYFDKTKVREVFKKGDEVIIKLGYNGNLETEFTGYISKVSADVPIKIKCQDAMYLLKKHPVNMSLKTTNLPSFIKSIVPDDFDVDVMDIDIGTTRWVKTTVAKVLEKLQEDYNIYSYIREGKTLVVGKIYSDDTTVEKYDFGINVVENQLQYKYKEDISIKIDATSTLHNGDKIEVSIGDDDGEVRQLSYYNIAFKKELERLAHLDYDKFKIDGFEGAISTWGIPSVKHGYVAELEGQQYPDRNGKYYIKKVTKTFDDSPKYRQKLDLDKRPD